ncbi:MAG: succinate dehydrogenase assembly factor 2 [Gammaproteobacteria bacterium]|jgi:antitoxin CptB|nr:succinate dehydrogenase assembly factor 2 [Gammaproteobacteria bacterium]
MSKETELNRLFWHSRRGMLELDELLVPFVREAYTELAADDQARYEKLLSCEDQDMFAWFMRRSQPDDADLQRIIGLVLEHSRTRRA